MNTYESWRISYQSSESAAQAAWKEMIRLHHRVNELESAIKKQVERSNDLSWYMHDQITAQQAAWIEWQHGNGADAAMNWIHNGLVGPGHIPDGTDPQKWFDANCAYALRRKHARIAELEEQMTAIGAAKMMDEHSRDALALLKQMLHEFGRDGCGGEFEDGEHPLVDEVRAFVSGNPYTLRSRQEREWRIYIAGPMTGLPEYNYPAFNRAAAALRAQGWHVENPADHGVIDGAEWADYLAYDLTRLGTCGAIYMLPGWQKSKGATLERRIALDLGMAIFEEVRATSTELATELATERACTRSHPHENQSLVCELQQVADWLRHFAAGGLSMSPEKASHYAAQVERVAQALKAPPAALDADEIVALDAQLGHRRVTARHWRKRFYSVKKSAQATVRQLKEEVKEQCRLLGASAEKELALHARVQELEAKAKVRLSIPPVQLQHYRTALEAIAAGNTDPDGMVALAASALSANCKANVPNVNQPILIDGGDQRDITIHPPKVGHEGETK